MSTTPKRLPIYLGDVAKERARIARELHDGIAQELAAVGYSLDAEIGRSDTSAASRKSLRQIREQITGLSSVVRNEIYVLRNSRDPTSHKQLVDSLTSMGIEFSITGLLPDNDTGTELFKVLQELSRNAIMHSRASHVAITINLAQILFINNGESHEIISSNGFGLTGLQERLMSIGWKLAPRSIHSRVEISEGL